MNLDKRHYRALFFNNSIDSKKAVELLNEKNILFSPAQVAPDSKEFGENDLPLLITDEGQWQGLAQIELYVDDQSVI